MGLIEYILLLGVIHVVFGFVWKWVFVLPVSLLLALLRINKGIYLVKAFGSYLLVSLTALLTLFAIESNPGIGSLILYPFIGVFTIYMAEASRAYEAEKQAAMDYDYEALTILRYDGLFIVGAVILFIVTLFIPIIALNPITQWLFGVIDWAYSLPVLDWILRIAGILFLLSMIWQGILLSIVLIGSLIGKIKGEPKINSEIEEEEERLSKESKEVVWGQVKEMAREMLAQDKIDDLDSLNQMVQVLEQEPSDGEASELVSQLKKLEKKQRKTS